MTQRKVTVFILLLSVSLLLLSTVSTKAAEKLSFKEYIDQANVYIKSYRHFEASDALKKATLLGGDKHPSLHMRLAALYYGLGLLSEAIDEGEKAVRLAPSSKWYKYDLAKFYFVDKQYDKAEEMLNQLLQLDPGFTFGYYYLAQLSFHRGEYDFAWLCLQRAKQLGHRGKLLEENLEKLTTKPIENPPVDENNELFRFIKLSSEQKAREVLNKLKAGKLFEDLELELKENPSRDVDFGVMVLSELKESVAASLQHCSPYNSPVIIKTGSDYRIMQRILPFHMEEWKTLVAQSHKNQPALTTPPAPGSKPKQFLQSEASAQSDGTTPPETPAHIPPASKTAVELSATLGAPQETGPSPSTPSQNSMLLSSKLDAYYVLENWKENWESRNFKGYLAAYSDHFVPSKGLNRRNWENKRRNILKKQNSIKISLKDPVVEMLTPTQLLVTFKQIYRSNSYQDTVIKTLTMEKEASGWKITAERVIEKLN